MIKNPEEVSFWWSAGNVYSARFVKWVVVRVGSGGEDTNKLGVGALVESDWLFDKCIVHKIPRGCKRGQYIIRPYHPLYRSYSIAWKRGAKIRKPSVEEVRQLGEMKLN